GPLGGGHAPGRSLGGLGESGGLGHAAAKMAWAVRIVTCSLERFAPGAYLDPEMSAPLYMDAEIRPNRSLSERGFIILIGVVTLANCASAAVFIALGATLVPIFLSIDVLAVAVAFLVSF